MRRPESELDTIYLIGREWDRLRRRTRLESIEFHDGALDATGVYDGRDVAIEIERFSSQFFAHGHDPERCDLVICWRHDRDHARQRARAEALRREFGEDDPLTRRAQRTVDQQGPSFADHGIDVLALEGILAEPATATAPGQSSNGR